MWLLSAAARLFIWLFLLCFESLSDVPSDVMDGRFPDCFSALLSPGVRFMRTAKCQTQKLRAGRAELLFVVQKKNGGPSGQSKSRRKESGMRQNKAETHQETGQSVKIS